jgi:hypothetical protein
MSHPPTEGAKPNEAAEIYRNEALNAFETQRAAILQAISDHRAQALGTVQAARSSPQNSSRAPSQNLAEQRQQVSASIVAALKEMVAAEVRAQLLILLEAASMREKARLDVGNSPAGQET